MLRQSLAQMLLAPRVPQKPKTASLASDDVVSRMLDELVGKKKRKKKKQGGLLGDSNLG